MINIDHSLLVSKKTVGFQKIIISAIYHCFERIGFMKVLYFLLPGFVQSNVRPRFYLGRIYDGRLSLPRYKDRGRTSAQRVLTRNIIPTGYKSTGRSIAICLLTILFFSSCDITRRIPEGRHFLKKAELEIDTKEVSKSAMMSYMQQRPNDPKIAVFLYNWAMKDTGRWVRRMVFKAGQAPVIYNEKLTGQTIKNLQIEMANNGFFHATIDTSVQMIHRRKNKRSMAEITYRITSHEPYRIRNYSIGIDDTRIDSIIERRNRRLRSDIKPGDIFTMDKIEAERTKVSRLLRNEGYYTSTEDNIHYLADTSLHTHQVDLVMALRDSLPPKLYRIRKVDVLSDYDPFAKVHFRPHDSLVYDGLNIIYDSTHFLRPSVLRKNVLMHNNSLYSEQRDKQTYNHINQLGCVSRTSIRYNEVMVNDTAMLDCMIHLTQGNIHGTQVGIDGTNKAGNLGMAVNLSYNHYNLFNGGEKLSIKLRGAYELVSGSSDDALSHNFYEVGAGVMVSFPQAHIPVFGHHFKQRYTTSSEYGVDFNLQKRPEYTREFFNLNWKQRLTNEAHTVSQSISLIDINYVLMPWMSDTFKTYLNDPSNSLTRFSYENVFTVGIGYNLVYSNSDVGKFKRGLYTLRLLTESSGNLFDAIFKLADAKKSEDGQYNILGNPFAQYLKGDIDFAMTFRLNPKNSVAWHAAVGLAYPYGNSLVLPFEKRYFAGGPNSVRGWNTRYLGPGAYYEDGSNDIATHVGDMRLALSIEYRYKWMKWLEFAAFADAGNIWTLRNYDNQPNGQFAWDTFYRQIAMGCGVGIRLDLNFLVIRLDGGKKVFDPATADGARWVFLEKFKGNSALYLAIGYPF